MAQAPDTYSTPSMRDQCLNVRIQTPESNAEAPKICFCSYLQISHLIGEKQEEKAGDLSNLISHKSILNDGREVKKMKGNKCVAQTLESVLCESGP